MLPTPEQDWLLLIHLLPPKPTSLRVSTWRKLQRLGAVSIKNSVYILPFNEKTHEDFQWLKQEIESAVGEASLFRAGSVEGATDAEIMELFRHVRDEEYERVRAELDGPVGTIREQRKGGHLSPGRLGRYEAELAKLHTELERILATDFFGRVKARRLWPLTSDARRPCARHKAVMRSMRNPAAQKVSRSILSSTRGGAGSRVATCT